MKSYRGHAQRMNEDFKKPRDYADIQPQRQLGQRLPFRGRGEMGRGMQRGRGFEARRGEFQEGFRGRPLLRNLEERGVRGIPSDLREPISMRV